MAKKRNILEKTIALVDKKKKKAEEEFCSFVDVSKELAFVESIIPNDSSNIEVDKLTEVEFNNLLEQIYDEKEESMINGLKGAYYVIKNGIPLFDSQISKLNDFSNRVRDLKNRLKSSSDRFDVLVSKIKDYEILEQDLLIAKNEGIIDNDLMESVFLVLDMDEKDQNSFLYQVMEFNLGSYNSLEEVVENVFEEEKSIIDVDDLEKIFSKYGYDLSSLDDKYIKSLQHEGNLENIEGVFRAITENKMNFLQEKRKTKLLTQFLLFSNEDIINEVCSKFRENYVSSSYFTSYLPVFFPSEDKRGSKVRTRKSNIDKAIESETEILEQERNKNDLNVSGLHKDFFANIEYMKKNFGVHEKTLLERNVKLLTLNHSALIRHVEELELYGYDIHNENFPLSALIASRIMDSTDSFIEIGEENYIKRYASKLVFTCGDIVKRIYAYRESGLEYRSEGRIGMIKSEVSNGGSKCELAESTIDRLVPKDVQEILKDNKCKELLDSNSPRKISEDTLQDPIVVSLDERFKLSDSKYLIGDVIISRRKFLRNYEFLTNNMELIPEESRNKDEILLVSMINNSLLTANQIEMIDSNLKDILRYNGGNHGVSKK